MTLKDSEAMRLLFSLLTIEFIDVADVSEFFGLRESLRLTRILDSCS